MSDETTPEDSQSLDDSSTSEADERTFVSEKMIPESRFNEVYGKMKTLEREIGTLKEGKRDGTLTEDQQRELQAKEYLKGLLKETLSEQERTKQEQEQQEAREFKDKVDSILAIHTDVKKDDFLKFLEEEGDDYASVDAAMKVYKRFSETAKDASEKAKQSISKKPKLPSSEGTGGSVDYAESDKGKTMWQIAQEAARELSKK